MTIFHDKYGIIINLEASEGLVTFRHPTSPVLHGAAIHQDEEYEGPVTEISNYRFTTCHDTFLAKLRATYQFGKWLFLTSYTQSKPSSVLIENAQTPTSSE